MSSSFVLTKDYGIMSRSYNCVYCGEPELRVFFGPEKDEDGKEKIFYRCSCWNCGAHSDLFLSYVEACVSFDGGRAHRHLY